MNLLRQNFAGFGREARKRKIYSTSFCVRTINHETIVMNIKPSKKLGKLMLEVNARTEPRVAAALFTAARKLPAIRLKNILATTDFSKLSLEGVRYAVSLADKVGAAVALVHVIEPASHFAGMESVALAQEDATVIDLVERQAARLAEKQSKKNVVVTSFVRHGKAFHEIAALARGHETDLIVIATHGHTGLKRVWMGSTAERVVRHAPCAVLTVPTGTTSERNDRAPAFRLKKIVVPIDFSETSAQALPYAAALAERFGAEIILLHVIEWVPVPAELGYAQAAVPDADKGSVVKDLSKLREEAFDEDISGRSIVRTGTAFQEITKAARNLGADLIVLTTHGYTGLKHVVLGSTAERVVRHADCPVLVVREKARVGRGKRSARRRARK